MAANDLPSINDVTYTELFEIVSKVLEHFTLCSSLHFCPLIIPLIVWPCWYVCFLFQLKDESGQLMGVDTSKLLIANSGNDLPVSEKTYIFAFRFLLVLVNCFVIIVLYTK